MNIYRMGNLLQALQRVQDDIGRGTGDSDTERASFRVSMLKQFEPDFPPIKRVVKQLEAGTCKIK